MADKNPRHCNNNPNCCTPNNQGGTTATHYTDDATGVQQHPHTD